MGDKLISVRMKVEHGKMLELLNDFMKRKKDFSDGNGRESFG